MPAQLDSRWSWLVCFCATTTNVLHFGFSLSFGVYLPVLSDYFKESKEKTAWVGSLAIGLTLFVGPIAVILSNKFGQRMVIMACGLICSISLASSSFVNHLIILYFSYGILFGLSGGVILNTSLTSLTLYFKNHWAAATGFVTCGSVIGLMILSPCNEALIEAIGWRNALRVMSGLMLVICAASTTYVPVINQDNTDEEQEGRLLQPKKTFIGTIKQCKSLFKNSKYDIGLIAIVLTYFGIYSPHIHLVQFAKDLGISNQKAAEIFIYFSLSNSVSRIVFGQIHNRFSPLSSLCSLQLSMILSGLSVILLSLVTTGSYLIVFGIIYGIGNGGFILFQNIFFMSVVKHDQSSLGLGVGYMISSIAVCGGPVFTGYLADKTGSYITSFYITGGIMVFAGLFPCVVLIGRVIRWVDNRDIAQVEIVYL